MASGDRDRKLRIRMYDIGFGDCFLLLVPDGEGVDRLVLVDFGRHLSSSAGNTLAVVGKDLAREAKARGRDRAYIDVVVATHRHFDHIAGFDLAVAKKFHAGEVWLPWTEDPSDPAAAALKQRQFDFARALSFALDDPAKRDDKARVADLLANSHPDTVAFGLSNSGAMDNLLGGLAGGVTPRFLPEQEPPGDDAPEGGRSVATFETSHLPGVVVHVCGPSRDPEVISRLEPPKGEYFEFVDGRPVPKMPPRNGSLFASEYQVRRGPHSHRSDFDELQRRAFDVAFGATALEDMVNGTSLVLVLEIGDAVVVLGGDAEWGTWEQMLDDDATRSLLARTTVYKVSHHGSYNGTPRRYIDDLMPKDAISLVSLCPMERWPSIPRTSLLAALGADRRQVVRTDRPAKGGVVTSRTDLYTEIAIPF